MGPLRTNFDWAEFFFAVFSVDLFSRCSRTDEAPMVDGGLASDGMELNDDDSVLEIEGKLRTGVWCWGDLIFLVDTGEDAKEREATEESVSGSGGGMIGGVGTNPKGEGE